MLSLFLGGRRGFPSKQFWKRPDELGGLFCWSSFGQDWSSTGHAWCVNPAVPFGADIQDWFPKALWNLWPWQKQEVGVAWPSPVLLLGRDSHVKGGGRKEPK